MGCGCGKKRAESAAMVAASIVDNMEPSEWGPVFWKILHCFSVRVGMIGDKLSDTDQARAMELLIGNLGEVLPCEACQGHFKEYLAGAGPLGFVGRYGVALRGAVELWLLNLHNAVRTRLEQPIMISTVAEYETAYADCTLEPCELEILGRAAKYAIDHGIVKPAAWKRWFTEFKRLKITLGA
jgi:hypothetical protein